MKLNKLALALAAGCAIVSTVKADTTFYINGSTAYRKATYAAIKALYTDGVGADSLDANYPIGDTSSTATGSGAANVVNTVGNGSANLVWSGNLSGHGLGLVKIICNWSGSVSGVKFNAENTAWNVPGFLVPGTTAGTEVFDNTKVPDMCMADCFQLTTTYHTPIDPAAVAVDSFKVSVVDFLLCKDGNGAPLTGVSSENLRALYAVGYMNMAQLTGNPADNTKFVLATGRDDDSGTRTVFQADQGIGFLDNMIQWGAHGANIDSQPYSVFQFPQLSVNNNDGTGYTSGGTVATVLNDAEGPAVIQDPSGNTLNNVNAYLIGYVSVTDATGNNPVPIPLGQYLTYNGVAYSVAAVEEGQYTYWGYENLEIRHAHNVAPYSTIRGLLVTGMMNQAGTINGTLAIGNMNCARTSDGGLIAHN